MGITSEPANLGEILTQEVVKEVVSYLARGKEMSGMNIFLKILTDHRQRKYLEQVFLQSR